MVDRSLHVVIVFRKLNPLLVENHCQSFNCSVRPA